MTRATALALLAASVAGCSTARTVPDADRHSLAAAWDGKVVYLRSSLNVLPFYADATKRLVSPLHADSILPATDARGAPVGPGPVESMLPMGTRVRVDKLEFPTGLVVARRPVGTPRESPWVFLSYAGAPRDRAFVAVLRASMTTREDALAALADLFSEEDPSAWLKNVAPETKKAIEEKRLVAGMDRDQVLLAWGRPERIRQDFETAAAQKEGVGRPAKYVMTETWTWPAGARSATFKEGRLTAAAPPLASAEP